MSNKPFQGLGWFYQGQGAYNQALPWLERFLNLTKKGGSGDYPPQLTVRAA
ncbi:MAG: hypothetical protein F6K37_29395 [Moorea sp. SIO4E2]|uniref:hypothetical protein n=1 Tax=Moorena sp. SIO4E2 TaxID=2607826 RepID=UPI0013B8CAF4|nr:hypothetical protein [Moorena sp. SIO4E2]NEQ09909.1 hypothetical protein [Moorena sp. SIO4E2]